MQNEIVKKELVDRIEELIKSARNNVAVYVNSALLVTYMEIGRIIVEEDTLQTDENNRNYKSIRYLSKLLTKKYGRGFSVGNIHNMVMFYKTYSSVQSLSEQLSWTHYCELLTISDSNKRHFYEKECENAHWSVRELRRQIDSSLYERILLSKTNIEDKEIEKLSNNGNEIVRPEDIIKDPYVLEFVGIPENKPKYESDLEKALVEQIESFMLELGKGFMFVGTQQRVTFDNVHYYVDMVFYNKILKSYVLIELKNSAFFPEAVGQLNMYLNYYAAEVNDENDNPPIGIILCTDKGNANMEYALGGLSNKIFASRYITNMPKKEELIRQVEMVIERKNK